MKIKIFLLLSLFIGANSFCQAIEVRIETPQAEYNSFAYRMDIEPIILNCVIKNNSNEPVVFRLSGDYSLLFDGGAENFGQHHCFTLYHFNEKDRWSKYNENGRDKESFVTIEPGMEYIHTGKYNIGWLCRSGTPMGDWSFDIRYNRMVTEDDNFYYLKSYYSDTPEKVFVKEAWTGTIESNVLRVTVKDN